MERHDAVHTLTVSFKVLFLFAFLLLCGVEAAHKNELRHVAGLIDAHEMRAGDYVAEKWGKRTEHCVHGRSKDELMALARAILAVETMSVSPSEYKIESLAVWLAASMGVPLPSLSVGPGQIVPDSERVALASKLAASAPVNPSARELAGVLMDPCGALSVAVETLKRKTPLDRDAEGYIKRSGVMKAAAWWNGQSDTGETTKLVAHARYREIVYQTFQIFRSRPSI